MAFPLDTALQVTRANFRLGLGLMDVTRKGAQRFLEIAKEEATEIAEEGRLALERSQAKASGEKPGWPLGTTCRLQDIAGEFSELQLSTVAETRSLFENWWQSLSGAMVPDDNIVSIFRFGGGGEPAAPARKARATAAA